MTDDEQHHTEVVRSVFRPDHWTVRCSCGYQSGMFTRKLDAEMDADEHVLALAR